jgi:hypothetical protein
MLAFDVRFDTRTQQLERYTYSGATEELEVSKNSRGADLNIARTQRRPIGQAHRSANNPVPRMRRPASKEFKNSLAPRKAAPTKEHPSQGDAALVFKL